MTTSINGNDPRAKRTRQLLLEAFKALAQERQNVYSISVQEITERATVNRATFYAHFEDKYALLEYWMREKFHGALESQIPSSSTLHLSTLHQLVLAIFNFLARARYYDKPSDQQYEPFFEVVIQQELNALLLRWLKQVPTKMPMQEELVETTAQVISWGIFGSAARWSRGDRSVPAEEMANRVLKVVIAGLAPVVGVLE